MCREPIAFRIQLYLSFSVCLCLGLIAGCTTPPPAVAPSVIAAAGTYRPSDHVMVIRNGRYTLVELLPENDQGDLMQQIVDITFPTTVVQTVADALRYLLLRSGYRLKDDCEALDALAQLLLPATHLHLGPLTLRSALEVLVGAGWQLNTDDASRTVCFAYRDSIEAVESIQSRSPEHGND